MTARFLRALACAALTIAILAPAALAELTPVTVRVEGEGRTLLPERRSLTLTRSTFITKDGDVEHACQGDALIGAFELATRGLWDGSYSDGLGWFVQRVGPETHDGTDTFWSIWINNAEATAGLCDFRPEIGDEVLVFPNRCDFSGAQPDCAQAPGGLRVPLAVTSGVPFRVRVVSHDPAGAASSVAGAVVIASGGQVRRTDARGFATFRYVGRGTVLMKAFARGIVRTTVERVQVRPPNA